jgi:hypothetical protein
MKSVYFIIIEVKDVEQTLSVRVVQKLEKDRERNNQLIYPQWEKHRNQSRASRIYPA